MRQQNKLLVAFFVLQVSAWKADQYNSILSSFITTPLPLKESA